MAQFTRLQVLNEILTTGLVPLFDAPDVQTAKLIARSCADGGAHVVEFRNRGSQALMTFTELVQWARVELPDVIVGAGTILDAATAGLYLACGAEFVVSPILNPEVARLCNRHKVAHIPGCGSVSEISAAEELGAEICKIFPGKEVGGPGFVKAALGPCPWFRLMPTGGVDATEESVTEWIKAGAACLGMGSRLITDDAVRRGDYASITRSVVQVLTWINNARQS